jgi:hypothetical protein
MFNTLSFRRAFALALLIAVVLSWWAASIFHIATPGPLKVFLAIVIVGFSLPRIWFALRPAVRRRVARWFFAIMLGGGMAASLSACGANSGAQLQALQAIVTDPNCQHDDKIAVVTGAGGIAGSFTATAERHCPVRGAPLTPGTVVTTTTTTPPPQ